MKTITRHACGTALALILGFVAPAAAHHVVWLDFSLFNLSSFGTVNGNTPPTRADREAIEDLILAEMQKDWAAFDVHLSRFWPPEGRYTRVRVLGGAAEGVYGCAGADCCPAGGSCTGIGSWDSRAESSCEVYAGSFASKNAWQNGNATTARIANALSRTASHELGHVLGLTHCHGFDDFSHVEARCPVGQETTDTNADWHLMTRGELVNDTERAQRDFFFTPHSSRAVLYSAVQPRNHWMALPDLTGDRRIDLVYGTVLGPDEIRLFGRDSNGSTFGPGRVLRSDGGDPGDLLYGVGRDLVQARAHPVSLAMEWRLFENFGGDTERLATAGNIASIFRWGDVDGDGRLDLVTGRVDSAGSAVSWTVNLMNRFGTRLEGGRVFSADAGNEGDLFFVVNVTDGDSRADLVAVRRDPANRIESVRVYQSTGTSFVPDSLTTLTIGARVPSDYVLLGDVDADGEADLVSGRVQGPARVDWFVGLAQEPVSTIFPFPEPQFVRVRRFAEPVRWAVDRGDAGDLFRLGDGDGDGKADLFFGRPSGRNELVGVPDLTTVEWFGALSTGTSFDVSRVWRSDAGDEGSLVP